MAHEDGDGDDDDDDGLYQSCSKCCETLWHGKGKL